MARKIIREEFVKIIENQINNELSPATVQHYQILLDKGLNEQRAKESLACLLYTSRCV